MAIRDGRLCRISKSGEHTNAPVAPDSDNLNTVMYVKEQPSYPKLYRGPISAKVQTTVDQMDQSAV